MSRYTQWLPRSTLYIGYKRYGLDGAAAVIEQRVAELGGNARVDSIEEMAAREGRRVRYEAERKAALANGDLGNTIRLRAASVGAELSSLVDRFNAAQPDLKLEFRQARGDSVLVVLGPKLSLMFTYRLAYTNSLDGAEMPATIWRGAPPMPGYIQIEQRGPSKQKNIGFDYSVTGDYVWIFDGRQYDDADLADAMLRWMLA